MLTLESGTRTARPLPVAAKLGLMVLVFGVLEDLVAHSLSSPAGSGAHTDAQLLGHFIVFVGMVLILLGVVVSGARQAIARRESARRSSKGAV
jgi:hypothetical protein